jgi:NADPH-dependent 2,4-dienoyl-CoA reductase/sulfur reductase-like enzyme
MHIAIIGNGISGVTAARFIRKLSNHRITIISSESEYFYSRTALMYIYMGHMRQQDTQPYEPYFWKKNRIDLVNAHVEKIDTENNRLILDNKTDLTYDKLIIATGSASNMFGWKGQDLDGVGGLYSLQDLENIEKYSKDLKRAVIVGGGLIGIELAEMFHARNIPVTFLVRENSFWDNVMPPEESAMINREILDNHIDLRLQTELKEIVDDGNGKACAVITNEGEHIECGFVGLTAGVHPNINFIKNSTIKTNRGIVVNEYLQTNIENIYAIGDCAEVENPHEGRRSVEAVWYTGKMMGETVAYTVCNQPIKYKPRLWFNSAKFIDIEYQVYGTVLAQPAENHASLYWEGEDGKKAIRIVYDNEKSNVLGFNLMGVRYRHEVCEKWILEETHIETVLQNLGLANFDPEFYKEYEADVIRLYNLQEGKNLTLKKKRGLNSVLQFLKRTTTLQSGVEK